MPDALARVTATLYRNDGAGDPATMLPLVGARVVAVPVHMDETAAFVDSRTRVVGVTDAAGVLWQTNPKPGVGALSGLALAAGSWRFGLPDGEDITATVTAGQVVDLLTLRGAVASPGGTVLTVAIPAGTGYVRSTDGVVTLDADVGVTPLDGSSSLTPVAVTTNTAAGSSIGALVGYLNTSAGALVINGASVAAGTYAIFYWSGSAWTLATGSTATQDTTAPTAGTLASSSITASGFTLTVSGASDAGGLHAQPYAFSTDAGATWSAYQTSAALAVTGKSASTAYTCQHRVKDAAGNVATGASITVTTSATADTTAPTWAATFTMGTPTQTSVVATASALATDNVGVTGYDVSYNGGTTWASITPSGSNFTLTGTSGTTYATTQLRAKDAAGNLSAPVLSVPSYTMASAFDPDSIANLTASYSVGALSDGAVTTIPSTKAGGPNLAGNATVGTVGGRRVLIVSGTETLASAAAIPNSSADKDGTLIVVGGYTSATTNASGNYNWVSLGGEALIRCIGGSFPTAVRVGTGTGATNVALNPGATGQAWFFVQRGDYATAPAAHGTFTGTQANMLVAIGGAQATQVSGGLAGKTLTIGTAGVPVFISEVLFYARALSDAELTTIYNALKAKWGTT